MKIQNLMIGKKLFLSKWLDNHFDKQQKVNMNFDIIALHKLLRFKYRLNVKTLNMSEELIKNLILESIDPSLLDLVTIFPQNSISLNHNYVIEIETTSIFDNYIFNLIDTLSDKQEVKELTWSCEKIDQAA